MLYIFFDFCFFNIGNFILIRLYVSYICNIFLNLFCNLVICYFLFFVLWLFIMKLVLVDDMLC